MRVLIVEDEVLLALELEDVLAELGHDVIGTAASRDEALAIATRERPDLALVDIHLKDGPTGIDLARALVRAGVMVVFLTANLKRIPPDFAGAYGAIEKPYTTSGLDNALHYIARAHAGRETGRPPLSLVRAGRSEAAERPRGGQIRTGEIPTAR